MSETPASNSDSPTVEASPVFSPERREAVRRAVKHWVQQLIDPGRRNNLLFFRDTQTTTLRLDAANPAARERLIEGRPVVIDELVDETLDDEEQESQLQDFLKRATTIYRTAQANMEEAGLETLFLAVGLATWEIGDGPRGRPPAAPVLLLPVHMNPRGRGSLRWFTLEPSGDVVLNPVLLHALAQQQVVVREGEVLDGIAGIEDGDPGLQSLGEAEQVYQRVEAAAKGLRGFEVRREFALGNFQYHKMAMVADLERNEDALVAHPLIAAIAGDASARSEITADWGVDPEPREFDTIPADRQNFILDADSSQELAIRKVLAGQSIVVQGPPGTGKSQTIANLLAGLTAAGKRTLFVAEKRAALDAVQKRLVACGLGHLTFDLHGKDIRKKALAAQMAEALLGVRNSLPDNGGDLYRAHNRAHGTLVEHHDSMHSSREPSGMSVYQMRCVLLGEPEAARLQCNWDDATIQALVERTDTVADVLDDLKQYADLLTGASHSPWAELTLTGATLANALKLADAAHEAWERVEDALDAIGFEPDEDGTLEQLDGLKHRIETHVAAASNYREKVWAAPLDQLARSLRPGLGFWFKRIWAWATSKRYRDARQEAIALRGATGTTVFTDLAGEIARAAAAKRAWSVDIGGSRPAPIEKVHAAQEALRGFAIAREQLSQLVGPVAPPTAGWERTRALFRTLVSDRKTPYRLARLADLLTRCRTEVPALMDLVEQIKAQRLEQDLWDGAYRYALAKAAYDQVLRGDPAVQGFDGRTHDTVVERYQEADRELLPAASRRVIREHAAHFIEVCNEFSEQDGLIRREAEKKSRHKSLRTLLDEAPDVLTALFPCWMASPLSVSQLLASARLFDVVVFDEASQVFPHDAVPAILRGQQLVVAGDRHQLPPTAFFATGDEDGGGDDAGAAEGFESLLDQASAFLPAALLSWHYRSKDERLIAFSNHHIYNGSLITFPGCGRDGQPLRAEVVPFRADAPESTVSGHDEVRRAVELILEHAEKRPGETLGVIAPGVEHARRLEAQLDQELALRPDLEQFFDPSKPERFFVKNLERVQGDERDAIIFTVGYSKDRGGSLPHRFGPITHEQGHRRLNVAVSRARRRMTVVSSFRWDEVDLSRSSSRGVRFLRDYLRFAESGGVILGDVGETPVGLNAFEKDVFDELTRAGLNLLPQYGSSGYRIDMVATHPERPGRNVLAIECDGASYHSSPIARERDRLRQEILERLGWRFHRIWSTDWWTQRETEVARAREAYEEACRAIDRGEEDTIPDPEPATPEPPVERPRRNGSMRPYLPEGLSITEYKFNDLIRLVRYIRSDGRMYTDTELLDEMAGLLGFRRKGKRIVATLTQVIEAAGRSA